jgi:hypothetical protein
MGGASSGSQDLDEGNTPTSDAIRVQLARILGAERFSRAERLKRFLTFVVHEYLNGNTDQLKEYSIALEVFEASEDFDPEKATIVRTTAARLRKELVLLC